MGTPRRAVLKRVCRSCFEPRRGRDPTGGLFVRKPTASGGRAFWRPPAGPRDATSRGRASASHPHSGQSVRRSQWQAPPGDESWTWSESELVHRHTGEETMGKLIVTEQVTL